MAVISRTASKSRIYPCDVFPRPIVFSHGKNSARAEEETMRKNEKNKTPRVLQPGGSHRNWRGGRDLNPRPPA
jgi:hypothetical protein